jgi:hypothetical protein
MFLPTESGCLWHAVYRIAHPGHSRIECRRRRIENWGVFEAVEHVVQKDPLLESVVKNFDFKQNNHVIGCRSIVLLF